MVFLFLSLSLSSCIFSFPLGRHLYLFFSNSFLLNYVLSFCLSVSFSICLHLLVFQFLSSPHSFHISLTQVMFFCHFLTYTFPLSLFLSQTQTSFLSCSYNHNAPISLYLPLRTYVCVCVCLEKTQSVYT